MYKVTRERRKEKETEGDDLPRVGGGELGFRVSGSGFRVSGFGLRVQGSSHPLSLSLSLYEGVGCGVSEA